MRHFGSIEVVVADECAGSRSRSSYSRGLPAISGVIIVISRIRRVGEAALWRRFLCF